MSKKVKIPVALVVYVDVEVEDDNDTSVLLDLKDQIDPEQWKDVKKWQESICVEKDHQKLSTLIENESVKQVINDFFEFVGLQRAKKPIKVEMTPAMGSIAFEEI